MIKYCFVGPPKTGTTWFFELLYSSDEISLPKKPIKEIEFFDNNFSNGFKWYIDQFNDYSKSKILVECAPTYWKSLEASERISKLNPEVGIIIGLRHPLSLYKSYYMHCLRKSYISNDFSQLDFFYRFYLKDVSYIHNISKWDTAFQNIVFYDFDLIKTDPKRLAMNIISEIGMEIKFDEKILSNVVNKGTLPRFKIIEKIKTLIFFRLKDKKGFLNILISCFRILKPFFYSRDKVEEFTIDPIINSLLIDDVLVYEALLKRIKNNKTI